MPDPIDSQAFLKLCEMSIDNMYELEALGALLEQKGLITKQEIIDLVPSLKQKTPPAPVVEPIYFFRPSPFPTPFPPFENVAPTN